MNWKEHPHLFANGKFKCKENNLLITGITWMNKEPKFWFENDRYFWAKDCQLIARPIEGMSNVEVARSLRFQGIEHEGRDFGYFENLLFDIVNENYDEQDGYGHKITPLTAKAQNYLLSIGVYPFSDTEDVIFKPKQS